MSDFRSIEICAGGQALGLEQAGFKHEVLIEIEHDACETLRKNRPHWNVVEGDVREFHVQEYKGIDLLAGGVPCPPFSVAGKQLGHDDNRDLFPEALRLVEECFPKAVMLENVKGLFSPKFDIYRENIKNQLEMLGYVVEWKLLQANHYGVAQLRPRTVLIAFRNEYATCFTWPIGVVAPPPTVGTMLYSEMASRGWKGAKIWAENANDIAPTIVGGSKKHGGADLGPTRSRIAWEKLNVDGAGIADYAPAADFVGRPKLTVRMAALIQGFPPDWIFYGKKTPSYRQVGNAFPPPVAKAVGKAIINALRAQENNVKDDERNEQVARRA